jgi:hypothetical protein
MSLANATFLPVIDIKIDRAKTAHTQRTLSRMIRALKSMRRPLMHTHRYLLAHLRRQFATAGAHGGTPWAGYNPKYAAYKRAILGHLDLLRWEKGGKERLFPALTDPNDPGHVFEVNDRSVKFGAVHPHIVKLFRGGTNQFGEPYPGRNPFAMRAAQKRELAKDVFTDVLRRGLPANTPIPALTP